MAKAGVITDIFDFEKLEKEQTTIIKNLEVIIQQQDTINKNSKGGAGGSGGGKSNTDAETKEMQRQVAELERLIAKKNLLLSENAKLIEQEKEAIRLAKLKEQAEKAAAGSIQQLVAQNKLLEAEYYAMSKAMRETSERGKELKKTLDENNSTIRNVKVGVNDMKANVGNYAESLKGLKTRMMESKETMGAMGNTINNTTNIFNSFSSSTSVFSKSISMVTNGISQLGGLLMAGGIGIALAAIAGAIWAISKAADMWVKRNDAIYESHIKLLRQLQQLKDSYNTYLDTNRKYIAGLTDQELQYSAIALEENQKRADALKRYQLRLKEINDDPTYKTEAQRLALLADASKKYADEITNVELIATGKRNEIAKEGLKVTESNINAIADEVGASDILQKKINELNKLLDDKIAKGDADIAGIANQIKALTDLKYAYDALANSLKGVNQEKLKPTAPQTSDNGFIEPDTASGSAPLDPFATGTAGKSLGAQVEEEKALTAKKVADDKAVKDALISNAGNFFNSLTELGQTYFDGEMARMNELSAKDQKDKEMELERAGGNKKKIKEINDRYDKIEKQREKERKKIIHDQAVYAKATSAIQAVINTAVAVTGMIANPGGPAGIALAVVAAALGAIEVATILAQNIPAYAKGTDNAQGGLSLVGERGSELVHTPSGHSYVTPDSATLVNLPKGSQVIPHDEFMQAAMAATQPNYYKTSTGQYMYNNGQQTKVEQNVEINLTKEGLWAVHNGRQSFEKYLNESVRFKA